MCLSSNTGRQVQGRRIQYAEPVADPRRFPGNLLSGRVLPALLPFHRFVDAGGVHTNKDMFPGMFFSYPSLRLLIKEFPHRQIHVCSVSVQFVDMVNEFYDIFDLGWFARPQQCGESV